MKPLQIKLVRCLPVAALCGLLAACNVSFVGSIGSFFSIGGTVTGLPLGQSLVLTNNGHDALTITANGSFVFGALVPFNGGYSVAVSSQPATATCVVSNGSGTATNDVNNVLVTCQARSI